MTSALERRLPPSQRERLWRLNNEAGDIFEVLKRLVLSESPEDHPAAVRTLIEALDRRMSEASEILGRIESPASERCAD